MMTTQRHLSPLAPAKKLYAALQPQFSFRAKSQEEWRRWSEDFRAKLREILGGFPQEKCDLKPEILERVEEEKYFREKVVFQSEDKVSIPAYVLVPKGISKPTPAVLAIHGHGRGKVDVAGIVETPEERQGIEVYNHDYGKAAAERGYVALAPDQSCFGERMEKHHKKQNKGSSCRQVSFYYQLLGKTIIGQRVWDAMRCIDYLETRAEVDAGRIACVGLSGGGTATLFSSALEDRIKVAVVSGYLNVFRDCILAMDHCECNYVPGILKYGEMYDVAGLIAPRPLLVESGTEDSIFPVQATEFAYGKVKRVYDLLGVPERLEKDIFKGGHKFSGRKAFDWLARWL
jgi:dienelactone hydrolase